MADIIHNFFQRAKAEERVFIKNFCSEVGMCPKRVSRYRSGRSTTPEELDFLLRLMMALKEEGYSFKDQFNLVRAWDSVSETE